VQLYLVRHCESTANVAGCFPPAEARLTQRGAADARLLAAAFAPPMVDRVLAGPLARTVDTAVPIAQRVGMRVEPVDDLTEIRLGDWEGRRKAELAAEQPELWSTWRKRPHELRLAEAETLAAVSLRAHAFFDALGATSPGLRAVAVTHQCVIRVLVSRALGLSLAAYREVTVDPGSISVLSWDAGRFQLEQLNVTDHLRPPTAGERARPCPS
jgi:broad specificity phosphatase PhoE